MPALGPSFWTLLAWSWEPKMRAGNLLAQPTGPNRTVELGAEIQRLLAAFASYNSDLLRWSNELNSVFATGGSWNSIRQRYQQEGVPMSRCLKQEG